MRCTLILALALGATMTAHAGGRPQGREPRVRSIAVHDQNPLRILLKQAPVLGRARPEQRGANPSLRLTLGHPDGVRRLSAIWKGRSGQTRGVASIDPATMYLREAAVSHLADALGLDLVPATTRRALDGEPGALQLLVGDVIDAKDLRDAGIVLDRATMERLRVFDYVIGNVDRHGGNLLVARGDRRPIAIDHGLSLPNGPMGNHFYWPQYLTPTHQGRLLDTTRDFAASIEPARVAGVLAASGIERVAAVHALRRLARVQHGDLGFLEIPREEHLLEGHPVLPEVSRVGSSASQGLSAATLARIDDLVDRAYAR